MRICYAARQLLRQIDCHEDCGAVGDPDGFGVIRTIMVPSSLNLSDPRIKNTATVSTSLGDVQLVQFKTGRLGDVASPFDL